MLIDRYSSAAEFLQAAQPFLESAEATNNLLLGVSFSLKNAPGRIKTTPYFFTVADGQNLTVAAMITPPHNLVIYSPGQHPPALERLAQILQAEGVKPPGVLGPSAAAQGFAQAWAGFTGTSYRAGMSQGIYELRHVIPPEYPASGQLRVAGADDLDRVTQWALDFQLEALGPGHPGQTREIVAERLDRSEIYLWEDGQPVSMVAKARPISHGITVNMVYTPPQFRRHGYAGNAVAALSQILLDEGWQFCSLHTDLANPTSNHIYQAIGYRRVCDFNEYIFTYN